MFLDRYDFLSIFLRSFHKKRKNCPQSQDVDEFVAVVFTFSSCHCVVQHLEGPVPGELLFPKNKSS